jgi:A/G-specific adenine glycosylase
MAEDGRPSQSGGQSRAQVTQDLSARLLAWYDAHGRDLPWRVKQGAADPYRVWLSEIMLQQTTVPAVKGYFLAFTARWPNVQALAAASLDEVLKAWAGLGYYARARNLHACAGAIVERHGGRFPETVEGLLALPGIGPYTAGAIAAIAFGQRVAAVDGNVERVLSRLHAIETPLPRSKPLIRQLAQALVPQARAGDFVQALMDLGATLCTPRSPACEKCPWAEQCRGRAEGLQALLPRKLPKAELPVRRGYAYWLSRSDGAVLLRRRPEKGLLGGMMEVPGSAWAEELPGSIAEQAPLVARWRALPGIVTHTFTHFHLEVTVCMAEVGDSLLPPGCRWVAAADVEGEALPTVMRKIVAHARKALLLPSA